MGKARPQGHQGARTEGTARVSVATWAPSCESGSPGPKTGDRWISAFPAPPSLKPTWSPVPLKTTGRAGAVADTQASQREQQGDRRLLGLGHTPGLPTGTLRLLPVCMEAPGNRTKPERDNRATALKTGLPPPQVPRQAEASFLAGQLHRSSAWARAFGHVEAACPRP